MERPRHPGGAPPADPFVGTSPGCRPLVQTVRMPNSPARFKDLCIDAVDPARLAPFWAEVLDRSWEGSGDGGRLTGVDSGHTIWVNRVPEPVRVKNRVHLDIYARTLAELIDLGSQIAQPQPVGVGWTVMLDPEGSQYCAFLRDEVPTQRLHGLVVDCADPAAIGAWWTQALGGELTNDVRGYSTISKVPGMPIETFDFVPVPEPKTVKNRIHWDVTGDPRELLAMGAKLLRPRDTDISWDVMADPDGNEFCVFQG